MQSQRKFSRIDVKSPGHKDGKWQRTTLAGSTPQSKFAYRDWQVEIISRRSSLNRKKSDFSVKLTGKYPPFNRFVAGLRSSQAATAAAKRIIDEWHETKAHLFEEKKRVPGKNRPIVWGASVKQSSSQRFRK